MHEVSEGEINAIARPTVIISHTNEFEIMELVEAKTNPPKNLQDNGAMPPVNTQPSPPHSPPEDTLVASANTPPCPRVEAVDAALQARTGDLLDVPLLGADYMVSTRIGCTKTQENTSMEETRKTVGGKHGENSLHSNPTLRRTFQESW